MKPESVWNKLASIDFLLGGSALLLTGLGLLAVYSATRGDSSDLTFLIRQGVFMIVGVAGSIFLSVVDYAYWRKYLGMLMGFSLVLLVAVLSPLGTSVNGTKGWFVVGPVSVQPAELVKLSLVVVLAAIFSGRKATVAADRVGGSLTVVGVASILVLVGGETGSVLIYGFIMLGVFLVAGVPYRVLLLILASGVLVFSLAFTTGVLQPYQKDRLEAFLDDGADPRGIGYNQRQAVVAIGSGGLVGQGLFQGPQTQLRYIPEQQTDFIFAVVGEELGFLGAILVIGLESYIAYRLLRAASLARDKFGLLLCAGVASMLIFQIAQNIGMNLKIMPVMGIPLPFISYGGSSLLVSWLGLGLVQSVNTHRYRGRSRSFGVGSKSLAGHLTQRSKA